MLTITNIELLKKLIAVLIVYFPIVAFSGFFAALVAKIFGDHTAENAGLLTINPLVHARISGLAILILSLLTNFPFIVGFGTYIPINEHNIDRPWRRLKYLVALWAKSIANIFLLCLVTIVFVLIWRFMIIPFGVLKTAPELINALGLVVMVFKYLNIMSALMEFIFGLVVFIMSILFPNIEEENLLLIFTVQISLLILTWHFIEPYINMLIIVIDNWTVYLVSGFFN
jgi:hypothetical protein